MRRTGKLLVEGRDDQHVFLSLLAHHNVPETFNVKDKKGFEKLIGELDVEHDESDLKRLGIVVDADFDLPSRWRSIKATLANMGYALPDAPTPDGTIVTREDGRVIGIWLMPDNNLSGMLEDFVSFLGATDDVLWALAEKCLDEVSGVNQRFIPNHRIKAHIHTWLSWQQDPGTPLGLAITKRYFDADAPPAQRLVGWIRELFSAQQG